MVQLSWTRPWLLLLLGATFLSLVFHCFEQLLHIASSNYFTLLRATTSHCSEQLLQVFPHRLVPIFRIALLLWLIGNTYQQKCYRTSRRLTAIWQLYRPRDRPMDVATIWFQHHLGISTTRLAGLLRRLVTVIATATVLRQRPSTST